MFRWNVCRSRTGPYACCRDGRPNVFCVRQQRVSPHTIANQTRNTLSTPKSFGFERYCFVYCVVVYLSEFFSSLEKSENAVRQIRSQQLSNLPFRTPNQRLLKSRAGLAELALRGGCSAPPFFVVGSSVSQFRQEFSHMDAVCSARDIIILVVSAGACNQRRPC